MAKQQQHFFSSKSRKASSKQPSVHFQIMNFLPLFQCLNTNHRGNFLEISTVTWFFSHSSHPSSLFLLPFASLIPFFENKSHCCKIYQVSMSTDQLKWPGIEAICPLWSARWFKFYFSLHDLIACTPDINDIGWRASHANSYITASVRIVLTSMFKIWVFANISEVEQVTIIWNAARFIYDGEWKHTKIIFTNILRFHQSIRWKFWMRMFFVEYFS